MRYLIHTLTLAGVILMVGIVGAWAYVIGLMIQALHKYVNGG